jgi:hypothetical protein
LFCVRLAPGIRRSRQQGRRAGRSHSSSSARVIRLTPAGTALLPLRKPIQTRAAIEMSAIHARIRFLVKFGSETQARFLSFSLSSLPLANSSFRFFLSRKCTADKTRASIEQTRVARIRGILNFKETKILGFAPFFFLDFFFLDFPRS